MQPVAILAQMQWRSMKTSVLVAPFGRALLWFSVQALERMDQQMGSMLVLLGRCCTICPQEILQHLLPHPGSHARLCQSSFLAQRMVTALQTGEKKENHQRYKNKLMLLRKLKMKIEAASSMHQASYPAMPCKEHGTILWHCQGVPAHKAPTFQGHLWQGEAKQGKDAQKWASCHARQNRFMDCNLQLIDNYMSSLWGSTC